MNAYTNIVLCLLFLFTASSTLQAQSEITNPIVIPLYHPTNGGASDASKWGIYLSIGGGSTPALFELDTGGTGFYSAYATNSASPWWGNDFLMNNATNGTNLYESGLSYSGATVFSSVSFWTNTTASGSTISSPTNVLVGQSSTIGDTNGHVFWDTSGSTSSNPPIQNGFYGDFGLSLQSASNALVNIIAQMKFGGGTLPGFLINAPLNGDGGYLQIGLSSTQTNAPGFTYFAMSAPSNSASFNNNPTITYKNGALVNATITLSSNSTPLYSADYGVIADTGAHPNLHYTNATPALEALIDTNAPSIAGEYYLTNGLGFTITATNIDGSVSTLQSFTTTTAAGENYASNEAAVMAGLKATNASNDSATYNSGLFLFNQNQVIYDLQDGTIGFGLASVPEPSPAWLLLTGLGILRLFSSRFRNRSC